MPTVPPIKKNDEVYILRGKDRGKTGRVLIVNPGQAEDRGRRRSDDQAPHAAESAEEHQGRHRGEGSVDPHFERGASSARTARSTRASAAQILADGRHVRDLQEVRKRHRVAV